MKNKKKKQLPLLLLALLFITTAAYGTRAYFTDEAKQEAEIKLTLGNLAITNETESWKYTGNGNTTAGYVKDTVITDAKDMKFVQPGDSFTRTFKFTNTGSLDQVVTLNTDILEKNADVQSPFTVSVGDLTNDKEYTLKSRKSITFDVKIEVPADTQGAYNGMDSFNGPNEYTLDYLQKAITVTVKQTNEQ